MALHFLMEPFQDLAFSINIDVLIVFMAKLQQWMRASNTALISKVELWSKMQLCLTQAFALKNGEVPELQSSKGPISYE